MMRGGVAERRGAAETGLIASRIDQGPDPALYAQLTQAAEAAQGARGISTGTGLPSNWQTLGAGMGGGGGGGGGGSGASAYGGGGGGGGSIARGGGMRTGTAGGGPSFAPGGYGTSGYLAGGSIAGGEQRPTGLEPPEQGEVPFFLKKNEDIAPKKRALYRPGDIWTKPAIKLGGR